jgi:ssDNA-binding replication factor A large subunit
MEGVKMAIKDLEVKQGNVDLTAEVVEIGEVREFNKFGKTGRVSTAKLKDESGEVNLSLWNEDIDKIKVGDTVQIKNGFVNEWQGTPQLTTGRQGTLEVVEGGAETPAEEKAEEEMVEATEEPVEESSEEATEEPEKKEESEEATEEPAEESSEEATEEPAEEPEEVKKEKVE